MRHLLVTISIVTLLLSGSRAFGEGACEIHAKKSPATAAVNLLMDGRQHDLVSDPQLEELAATDPATWSNPFAPHERSLLGHSLFKGFERLLKLLKNRSHADKTQRKLQATLAVHRVQQAQVQNARKETQNIFGKPLLLGKLYLPGKEEFTRLQGRVTSGKLDGRPIFVAVFRHHTELEFIQVLFDPFHLDPLQRAHLIREGKNLNNGQTLEIFDRAGSPYLLSMGDNFAYDIKNKTEISPQAFGIREMEREDPLLRTLARTPKGDKLVISQPFQNLVQIHGLSAGTFHEITKCRRFLFHRVGARNLITCFDFRSTELLIYDVDEEKFLTPAKIGLPSAINQNRHAMLFEENGEIQVAVIYERRNGLERLDVKTGNSTPIADLHHIEDLNFKLLEGRPHFVLQNKTHLLLRTFDGGNLRSFETPTGSGTITSGWITWHEELHYYNVSQDHFSRVYTLSGTPVSSFRFSTNPRDAYVFDHAGAVYGLYFMSDDLPALHQLTAPEDK